MLLVLKTRPETQASATATKFVLSAWPQFQDGYYSTCVCNVSLTLQVAVSSQAPISKLVLLGERRYFAQHRPQPLDISHTLLDADNPITYSTNGAYRRRPGSSILRFYDGLPDVAVDDRAHLSALASPEWAYVRFDVRLARPIPPGHSAAIRFCFLAPGLFAAAGDGTLRFHLTFQSDFPLRQLADPAVYLARAIPMLNVDLDGIAGGLDVFMYMPLEFDGDDFTVTPVAKLLPDYDYLGRQVDTPRLKFCWSGAMLRPRTGQTIAIGESISLDGRFTRRHMSVIHNHNHYGHVDGHVFAGPVAGSALSRDGTAIALPASSDPEGALRLLEQLQAALANEATSDVAELSDMHIAAIESDIRGGRFAQARRRLSALANNCGRMADAAVPILESIDHIGRMLK